MSGTRALDLEAIKARHAEAVGGRELARFALQDKDVPALVAEVERLRLALGLAEGAMNHMGDVLNEMDAVEAEDEKIVAPAFRAVRAALGKPLPGDENL